MITNISSRITTLDIRNRRIRSSDPDLKVLLDPAVHGMGAPKGSIKSVHFLRVFGVPFLRVFVSLDRECDLQRPFGSDKLVFFYLAFLKRVPMVVKQSFVVFPTRLSRLKPQDSELAKCNFPKFCNLYGFSRLWLTHFQIALPKAVPDLNTSIPSGNKS